MGWLGRYEVSRIVRELRLGRSLGTRPADAEAHFALGRAHPAGTEGRARLVVGDRRLTGNPSRAMAVVPMHARVPTEWRRLSEDTMDVLEKIARVQQWTGFAAVCAFAGIVIGLR